MNKLMCINTKISVAKRLVTWSIRETFAAKTNVLFNFGLLDVCFTYNSVEFTSRLPKKRQGVDVTICHTFCVTSLGGAVKFAGIVH